MLKIKEIIVVEGKHDTAKLKQYFDVDTIETNGYNLSKQTIQQIQQANTTRGVILFLDPDHVGERIRRVINEQIPNLKNAFIEKSKSRTSKKVGIEHANEKDLLDALEHVVSFTQTDTITFSMEQFLLLGLQGQSDSAARRQTIANAFHLGKCNAKTLYKRINMVGLTYTQVAEIIEDTHG